MRRALAVAPLLALALVACSPSPPTSQRVQDITERYEELRAATPKPASQRQASLPWGGTAHLEVAASRDCADLQSWFDAADFQRDVLLDRLGPDDPGYEYAFDVMMQADDRMREVGCYG